MKFRLAIMGKLSASKVPNDTTATATDAAMHCARSRMCGSVL
jgi:hypothetical protein